MHLIPDALGATPHTSGQLHWSRASSTTTTTSALLSSPAKKGVWGDSRRAANGESCGRACSPRPKTLTH